MTPGVTFVTRPLAAHLRALEEESIYIVRETVAECARTALLYSAGKDSSVLLHLACRAFAPASPPLCLLHVDTTFKFPEMIAFRDRMAALHGLRLIVHTNQTAVEAGVHPRTRGTQRCCHQLKTTALLDALRLHGFTAAIGGARREEERSRAKERIFSFRNRNGEWDPRRQRPELWSLFNTRVGDGETMRVFPLSNWTELDVWEYIEARDIPVVNLYFAAARPMILRGAALLPPADPLPGDHVETVVCRMRTLGCMPCTGAIRSTAATVGEVLAELRAARRSERETRVIDHDTDGSMELKKREGYF